MKKLFLLSLLLTPSATIICAMEVEFVRDVLPDQQQSRIDAINAMDNENYEQALYHAIGARSPGLSRALLCCLDREKKIPRDILKWENGANILHYAAIHGNPDVIECIQNSFSGWAHMLDNDGVSPFHYACENNCLETAQALLKRDGGDGCRIQDKAGLTPLHYACRKGHTEIVRMIVACDRNLSYPVKVYASPRGTTPLHTAVYNGKIDCLKVLLGACSQSGCNYVEEWAPLLKCTNNNSGWTPLFSAVYNRQAECVRAFLEKGPDLANAKDDNGDTPLHVAVDFCSADDRESEGTKVKSLACVKELIEHGADCNIKGSMGETPLNNAISSFPYASECIKELILAGADPEIHDKDGRGALHNATLRYQAVDIINFLIKQGISVDSKDEKGRCALQYCIDHGTMEIFDVLVGCGADIRTVDSWGNTPLHHAAWYYAEKRKCWGPLSAEELLQYNLYRLNCLSKLLELGAQIDAKNLEGYTPLHRAVESNNLQGVIRLLEAGASLTIKNNSVHTPIQTLLYDKENKIEECEDRYALLKLFLEKKAERFNRCAGWTVLHEAVYEDDVKCIYTLLDKGEKLDAQNAEGKTALHVAAELGHDKALHSLLIRDNRDDFDRKLEEKSFLVFTKDRNGMIPLDSAISKNQAQCVLDLLPVGPFWKRGGKPEGRNEMIPLDSAISKNQAQRVLGFLPFGSFWKRGGKPDGTNNTNYVEFNKLVSKGCLVACEQLLQRDAKGQTVIHRAGINDQIKCLKNLIIVVKALDDNDKKLEILNAQDCNEWTPLHHAALIENNEAVKLLLEAGAQIDCIEGKHSPLHVAAIHGRLSTLKLLIDKGASQNTLNFAGRTPVGAAACSLVNSDENTIHCLRFLLQARTEDCDESLSDLHRAVKLRENKALEKLLNAGDEVNAVCNSANTPLHEAADIGNTKAITLLLRIKANIDAQNDLGHTPLHLAISAGHNNIVKELLNNGANANLQTTEGNTALHCAVLHRNCECTRLLLSTQGVCDHIENVAGKKPYQLYIKEPPEDLSDVENKILDLFKLKK